MGKVLNPLKNLKSESLFLKGDAILVSLQAELKVCYINDVLLTICKVYTAHYGYQLKNEL